MIKLEKEIRVDNFIEESIYEHIKKFFSNKENIVSKYNKVNNSYSFNYSDIIKDRMVDLSVELYLIQENNQILKILIISFDDSVNEMDLDYYYFKEIYFKFTEGLVCKNEETYTVRVYHSILHDVGIKGEYTINWINKIKFKSLFNEKQKNTVADRIIVFDCEVKAISLTHARTKAINTVKEFASYLSVLIDTGICDIHSKYSHYIRKEGQYMVGEFQRNAFFDHEIEVIVMDNMNGLRHRNDYRPYEPYSYFSIHHMDSVGYEIESTYIENNSIKLNRNLDETFKNFRIKKSIINDNVYRDDIPDDGIYSLDLRIPKCIRNYYKGIKELPTKQIEYFRNMCRLYNISKICGAYEPTLKLAYMVSAVDCLAKSEKTSFSEFMKKYLNNEYDKKFCDFLYGNLRSGHFHSGEVFFGEYNVNLDITLDSNYQKMTNDYHKGKYYIRKAIVNWIKTHILKKTN